MSINIACILFIVWKNQKWMWPGDKWNCVIGVMPVVIENSDEQWTHFALTTHHQNSNKREIIYRITPQWTYRPVCLMISVQSFYPSRSKCTEQWKRDVCYWCSQNYKGKTFNLGDLVNGFFPDVNLNWKVAWIYFYQIYRLSLDEPPYFLISYNISLLWS